MSLFAPGLSVVGHRMVGWYIPLPGYINTRANLLHTKGVLRSVKQLLLWPLPFRGVHSSLLRYVDVA